jgi:hypothetical protein
MPDTQPAAGTVTIASQSIELVLTGKPDVPYKWGTGSIRPRIVIVTYRQDGIRAHLYGVWVREDGQPADDPCDQEYRVDDADWPDWLVELAAVHDPRTKAADRAPDVDRAALRDRIARALAGVTVGHKAFITVDVRAEYPRADAVLAALPVTADRATVLREAADTVFALDFDELRATSQFDSHRQAWDLGTIDASTALRRMADQTQPAEAQPPHHRWSVETRDGVADQWAPGTPIADRDKAVERYEHATRNWPTWKDGTPVQRRLVRATTTYTVVAEHAPSEDGEAPEPGP